MKKFDSNETPPKGKHRPQFPDMWSLPAEMIQAQRNQIWESVHGATDTGSSKERLEDSRSTPVIARNKLWRHLTRTQKWAAAWVVLFGGIWINQLLTTQEACVTFACLWEKTSSEDLELPEEEIDLWLEDDLLFEELNDFNPS